MISNIFIVYNNIEQYYIQFIIAISLLYLYNSNNTLNKIWSFFIIVFWIGILCLFNGYEIMTSFLWVIELTLITILLLLVFSDNNYSLNNYSGYLIKSCFYINYIIISVITILYIYIYNNYIINIINFNKNILKGLINTHVYINISFINYYKDNININHNSIIDIKSLGENLFQYNSPSLFMFTLLLLISSFFLITTYLISFNKIEIYRLQNWGLHIKSIRRLISKSFLKKQNLDKQLLTRATLRKISK